MTTSFDCKRRSGRSQDAQLRKSMVQWVLVYRLTKAYDLAHVLCSSWLHGAGGLLRARWGIMENVREVMWRSLFPVSEKHNELIHDLRGKNTSEASETTFAIWLHVPRKLEEALFSRVSGRPRAADVRNSAQRRELVENIGVTTSLRGS